MTVPILVADPRASLEPLRAQLMDATGRVLGSGRYILGEEVGAFEREWSSACGAAHAVGVSSGTDALALALRAVGVGPGDEVLVPAMTAIATWMAVAQIGAVPVGVDIEPLRRAIDPARAHARLSARTRAIVAVHLYGQPADIAALTALAGESGLPLVEDAAQAHLAREAGRVVGTLGTIAAFSFYPTKNLGALGDAGAVTTADPTLADRVRMLREYGWRTRDKSVVTGLNARLDELQAALLRVMLPGLPARTARRQAVAQRYLEALAGTPGLGLPRVPVGSEPVWHLFAVDHPHRDALAQRLAAAGIATAVHYRTAPHQNPAFADAENREGFTVAERHARESLSLPMHPALTDDDVDRVIAATADACTALAG